MMRETTSFFMLLLFAVLFSSCGKDQLAGDNVCSSDVDCGPDEYCNNGECFFNDGCYNGGCINNTNNSNNYFPCLDDSDCKDGEFCGLGECLSAACEIPDAPFCRRMECDGQSCSEEICIVTCPPGLEPDVCDCVPESCSNDEQCDGGSICVDGQCGACTSNDQCGFEEVCTQGLCVPDQSCGSDADCPAEKMCNPDGYCVRRPECLLDTDCGDDELCIGGRCTLAPMCRADLDCPAGFECIAGNCFEALCRSPEDCTGGQICDGGECVDPPVAISCFVGTPGGLITENQLIPLEAFALNSDGLGVAARFSWTSSAPQVASVDGSNAKGAGGSGVAVFTATLATGDPVACSGEVRLTNPGPVVANQLRIVVTHAETGAPIDGATVVIGSTTVTTANGGIAAIAQPAGVFEVGVFHDDFNYLTIQGIQTNDVRIPLTPKTGTGPVGGFTGEFDMSLVGSTGDVNLGLAGASLAGGIMDLNLNAILGESFVTEINIPGMGSQTFPMPGGIVAYGSVFGFNFDIKRTYYASATGGARFAWGLAGKVPVQDLIDLGQGGGGLDLISILLPLFTRFDHTAQPMLLAERPRIVDSIDINGNGDITELVPDYLSFPVNDLRPGTRQNLATDVDISNFPSLPGGTGEIALLMGGTYLNAPGLVPLGISATNDDDGDGRPDARRLSIAPVAGALAGGRYNIVAIAFRGNGGGGSFAFPTDISVALWNGQNFPTAVRLGTFPDLSTATITDANRSIALAADAGPMYRVRMVATDRTWDVWTVGPAGVAGSFTHTITIPTVPSGATDLFLGSGVVLDAVQTNATINDLVQPTGVGLRNLGLVVSSFNRTEIR